MSPNSDSPVSHYFPDEDEFDGEEPDSPDVRERNAKRAKLAVAKMLERARVRQDWWRRQLADERCEDFKPEMRRRIAVEQALIDGLEQGRHPTTLLPTYLREAVHRPLDYQTSPASETLDDWLAKHGVTDPVIVQDPYIRPRMVKIRETMLRLAKWKERGDVAGITRETNLLFRQMEDVRTYAADHRRCLTFQD